MLTARKFSIRPCRAEKQCVCAMPIKPTKAIFERVKVEENLSLNSKRN